MLQNAAQGLKLGAVADSCEHCDEP